MVLVATRVDVNVLLVVYFFLAAAFNPIILATLPVPVIPSTWPKRSFLPMTKEKGKRGKRGQEEKGVKSFDH